MNKVVKYCVKCRESFGERFSFCPVCGEDLHQVEAGETNQSAVDNAAKNNVNFAESIENTKPKEIVFVPVQENTVENSVTNFSEINDDLLDIAPTNFVKEAVEEKVEPTFVTSKLDLSAPIIAEAENTFAFEAKTPKVEESTFSFEANAPSASETLNFSDVQDEINGENVHRTNKISEDYHLTFLEDKGLFARLGGEFSNVAQQSQLSFPEFKRDPGGFIGRAISGFGTAFWKAISQPNVATGIFASTVLAVNFLALGLVAYFVLFYFGIFAAIGKMLNLKELFNFTTSLSLLTVSLICLAATVGVILVFAKNKLPAFLLEAAILGAMVLVLAVAPFSYPALENDTEFSELLPLFPSEPEQPIEDKKEGDDGDGQLKEKKKAKGGGGGGDENPEPADKGKLPPASLDEQQLKPNVNLDKVTNPDIPIRTTIKADPDKFPTDKSDQNYGDPNGKTRTGSNGPGRLGGIGTGENGGIGSGKDGGVGPGRGGNAGGGDFGLGGGGAPGRKPRNDDNDGPEPPPTKPKPPVYAGPAQEPLKILSQSKPNYTDEARKQNMRPDPRQEN